MSAVIVKIVSRAIMASNKNVVCLIKEAILAINFDGSWVHRLVVLGLLPPLRQFLLKAAIYHGCVSVVCLVVAELLVIATANHRYMSAATT